MSRSSRRVTATRLKTPSLNPSSRNLRWDGCWSLAHRPMPASARHSTVLSPGGYDATLVSDAHTTDDRTVWGAPPPEQVIAHTNLYWKYQAAPGRTAGTIETKDAD